LLEKLTRSLPLESMRVLRFKLPGGGNCSWRHKRVRAISLVVVYYCSKVQPSERKN
jgi:hypothetical protein